MSDAAITHDAFLSHSAKDKPVVRTVAERLRKERPKVWFDEWVLKPGNSIPAKIEEGRKHAQFTFQPSAFSLQPFPGLSSSAFGSDWAQLEAGTCGKGNVLFRDPLNHEHRLIPLRLSATLSEHSSRMNLL